MKLVRATRFAACLWRTLRFESDERIVLPPVGYAGFEHLLSRASPCVVLPFRDSDALMAEQDGYLFDGHAG